MKRIALSIALISSIAFASEDEFEDDFGGEEVIEIAPTVQRDKQNEKFSLYGSVSLLSSYNYAHDRPVAAVQNDFRGLSSVKTSANLNVEYKFDNGFKTKAVFKTYKDFAYDIKDTQYKTIPQAYDQEFDINELYAQGSLNSNTDIKIGRQIVVWGKSDNIRITDIINPMDNRNPGMVDIEDLRLGRTISKLDYYMGQWSLSAMLLHENRFSKMPEVGSDFAVGASRAMQQPSNTLDNIGIAMSLSGQFNGYDLAFYYANTYVDKPYVKNAILQYDKSNMLGVAYNKVWDSFLFKAEMAYFDNIRYNSTREDKARLDALVGFEYNGISDGSFSYEIANRHISNYENQMLAGDNVDKDEVQHAFRFTQSYMNQTLDFTALYSAFGKEFNDGGFVRAWLDYDINDSVSSTVGVINYLGGNDVMIDQMRNNDRVFASIKYSF
ncbi:MAG: DUF1302 family protein [Campylobacterota bacterium]|nr:DUF1302 family protein [Campylobacterota bacterium]